jgi:hypothetical protein
LATRAVFTGDRLVVAPAVGVRLDGSTDALLQIGEGEWLLLYKVLGNAMDRLLQQEPQHAFPEARRHDPLAA